MAVLCQFKCIHGDLANFFASSTAVCYTRGRDCTSEMFMYASMFYSIRYAVFICFLSGVVLAPAVLHAVCQCGFWAAFLVVFLACGGVLRAFKFIYAVVGAASAI